MLSKTRLLYLPPLFSRKPSLRIINYHWTPMEERSSLEQHFETITQHYCSLDQNGLRAFLQGKHRDPRNPIIISFDDGFRNNLEVASPLLEEYGLTGWFFVIGKAGYSDGHIVEGNLNTRYCMSWDELNLLRSKGHVIGCHTMNHVDLGSIDHSVLHHELVASRQLIESEIGQSVLSFAYPYGTVNSFSKASMEMINATYEFAFHSFSSAIRPGHHPQALGRICVESGWSKDILQLRLNGFLDFRYRTPRNRFFRMLNETIQ
ncbi:MAG: polysaccharide deacetylase family protein [Verrucomicrobiota bacterium]|nr:polysaccharide deacetylase family protein [Verrucomicrobiota bacterium]